MALTEATAPTWREARRAADALIAAGAGQVWLFGSVARGAQRRFSDIDLVAVLDDLDYRRRWRVETELKAAASAAAGRPVDVVVTDRPEWRVQQQRVPASFAAAIRADLTLLADRPAAVRVDWDKEQTMATSNEQLAMQRLDDVARQLISILRYLEPHRREMAAAAGGDRAEYEEYRAGRLVGLCEAAHLAVEGALKAVGTLTGVKADLLYQHDVESIADALPTGERAAMRELLTAAPDLVKTPGYITMWRTRGAYRTATEGMTVEEIATPRFAAAIVGIAADMAAAAVSSVTSTCGEPPSAAKIRARSRRIRDHMAHIDLGSGEPLDD